MTLDEGIKLLEKYRHDHHSYPTDIMGKAEQLGIEALKRVKDWREGKVLNPDFKLPGETEE
ncbi:unnamed protein product [marine sediment metagenome]|uniref:Uncharacterized protein n=1 Tax=marine sediment metagenome TaxID=412755 RepID=X1VG64_9ZZZZ